MFKIGSIEAAPGASLTGTLAVAFGMDGREITIPIAVVNGREPGPVLLVEGGLHGIEIVTIDICRRLLQEHLDPAAVKGTIILAPQLNPWAFHASTRVTPHDFQDMNRVFPGADGGTLSHKVARVITQELLDRADYVIDCHSCNPPSIHFTIVGEDGDPDVRETSIRMARAFGYPILNAGTAHKGTLRGYCVSRGKPSITPEFVFSRRLDETSIRTGVVGILNVLKSLKMLPGEVEATTMDVFFEDIMDYTTLSARKGGICSFTAACGEPVVKGDTLAILRDIWGTEMERILAPESGILLAYPLQANQAAATGDKIAYLAFKAAPH
ncbi:succinylglutamate desuccinylase/aspartoacylase family protein [Microvirga flavescens]|uniref:succinylglutamate desuccinylase/aspartoacylase family protein n=1 Tax=Microvirga flavescens TaxID=2249811 RepID=UPI000DDA56E1|nr:succinylglutamate desuccinylase/aspartoacylase family protein [Microvirga flavescens]